MFMYLLAELDPRGTLSSAMGFSRESNRNSCRTGLTIHGYFCCPDPKKDFSHSHEVACGVGLDGGFCAIIANRSLMRSGLLR
jgi:hypothetical protein